MAFDPAAYSPIFEPLIDSERLNPIGPGAPNTKAEPDFKSITVDGAFAGQTVRSSDMAESCVSAVWLYHNFLDESHTISQGIDTPRGSYWHGIMHRREPDFSNSKDWFQKVGQHPVREILGETVRDLITEPEDDVVFLAGGPWDPFAFVDLCEACHSGESPHTDLCIQIQQREFELLFDYSYRSATGK